MLSLFLSTTAVRFFSSQFCWSPLTEFLQWRPQSENNLLTTLLLVSLFSLLGCIFIYLFVGFSQIFKFLNGFWLSYLYIICGFRSKFVFFFSSFLFKWLFQRLLIMKKGKWICCKIRLMGL